MIERKECDVLVIGGGAAGFSASVAAAKAGASVVLIEKYGFLGGMATAGMVGTICGLYLRDYSTSPKFVSGGFMLEFAQQLLKMSRSRSIHLNNGIHVLPYDSWQFIRLCDNIISENNNITTVFHGHVHNVEIDNNEIKEASALVWNKSIQFVPKCLIDCTGEATINYLADCECMDEPDYNTPASVYSIDGIQCDYEKDVLYLAILRAVKRAVIEGELSKECERITFIPANTKDSKIYIKVSLSDWDNSDWNRYTTFETGAREIIEEIITFLKKTLKEFQNSYISRIPAQAGVRIGRRAKGQKIITEKEIIDCAKFEDGIACGAWPVELWEKSGLAPVIHYLPEKEYYEIPAACLLSDKVNNLFFAGRCISGTVKAVASTRVIGTSLSTGWAAGKLAAFRASGKSQSEAVKEIRYEQVTGF